MESHITCPECGKKSKVSELIVKLGGLLCPKCRIIVLPPEVRPSRVNKEMKSLMDEVRELVSAAYKLEEEKKMPVSSSHLALRFYKCDGWTKEILDQYIVKGRVVDIRENQGIRDYWFLDHEQASAFDTERLYEERISRVIRYSDSAELHLSDLEYLKLWLEPVF